MKRATALDAMTFGILLCRPLRGLDLNGSNDPGVPLRSTPGFMLSPASRASDLFGLTLLRKCWKL